MTQPLPSDALAEQIFLGGILNFPTNLDALRPRVHSRLFFSGKLRTLAECVLAAYDAHRDFDIPQVVAQIKRHPQGTLVVPADMLEVINSTAIWQLERVERALATLEDYHARRSAIEAVRVAEAKLFAGAEPFLETIRDLDAASQAAARPLQRMGMLSMRDGIISALTEAKSGAFRAVVQTPWRSAARDFPGLRKGGVTVLAATPGTGKSALAVQLAIATAAQGKGVLFMSLEMPSSEVRLRMMAHVTGVPREYIDERSHLDDIKRLQDYDIDVDDRGGVTVLDVRSAALQFKARLATKGVELGVLVVDHLHLMSHGPGRNDVAEIARTTSALKSLAKELDAPVLVLAQLNREGASRGDKAPEPRDLRGSGSIEQDADVILFLHKPAAEKEPHTVQFTVAKNRQGKAPVVVMLDFSGATSTFVEHDNQQPRQIRSDDREEAGGLRTIRGGKYGH